MPDQALLDDAASSLESAASGTTDQAAGERLADLSDQLTDFVESGRTPDHGRLARIITALDDTSQVADDVSDDIAHARDRIVTYRQDVEGV